MKEDKNGIISGQQGRVRDPHGMIGNLTEKQKEILRKIMKLLKELGVPTKVLQTGLLTDVGDHEGTNPLRYVFTGSFLLKAGDTVFYSQLNPSNIFEVVITAKI